MEWNNTANIDMDFIRIEMEFTATRRDWESY